ncbi:MAG TPA: patatin-like phospholipase family protein [Terriglobia bacterium]|nr:patatin-like phospholipase family protein [Terriglobia bacterium]
MNYRILSLDGGGTWALIELKALIHLYGDNTSGQAVLEDFDLVAANSGGSIVLGGLVEDLTLGEILALFQDQTKRESVFSPTQSFGDRILRDLTGLGPKYSAENKLSALQNALPAKGNVPLDRVTAGVRRPGSNEDVHLLMIGFDYDRNRAAFFRSSPASGPAWGTGETADVTLAEAIHASTNAPVNYFDAPATFPDRAGRYWDGAISGGNNPVLAAVTEAILKGQDPLNLAVLSMGTASVALPWQQPGEPSSPYLQQVVDPGIVTDLRKLALSILDDPPDIATFLAHVMTGSGLGLNKPPADSRVIRLNPLISPVGKAGAWSAPGAMTAAQFTYLANLDMDAVKQSQVDAISKYANLWLQGVAPNQPIRMNGDTLHPELGQTRFQDGVAAWNAIK